MPLILRRHEDEAVVIKFGKLSMRVEVRGAEKGLAVLVFEAPPEVSITREELTLQRNAAHESSVKRPTCKTETQKE